MVEREGGMNEHEQAAARRFRPERLELGRVQRHAVDLRDNDDAGESQLHRAARELAQRLRAAERMDVGGADEAPRIPALRLLGLVVDEARALEVGAHPGPAREEGGIDARGVQHPDVLVEVVEQRVRGVAGRARRPGLP
jgi:hypothetical protein